MGLSPVRGTAVSPSLLIPWRRGPAAAVQNGDPALSLPNLKLDAATLQGLSPGCSKIGLEREH